MSSKYGRYIQGCTPVRARLGRCHNPVGGIPGAQRWNSFPPVVVHPWYDGEQQLYATGELSGKVCYHAEVDVFLMKIVRSQVYLLKYNQ